MYQNVNGIQLYYEKVGQGDPIILLHGNGESHEIFDVLIEQLSPSYTVYAIDSRGHGNSSKVKSFDYETMSEDIAEFIHTLKLQKPILYGFSDGGILGLILAIRHPELLSQLIVSGANSHPEGLKPGYLRLFRIIYAISRSAKFRMMITQPNISEEQLRSITIPTLVLAGDNDIIDEGHTRYIAGCIPNSTLRILNGEKHETYVVHSKKLYEIIIPFIEVDK